MGFNKLTVLVGSKNPTKTNAVFSAFKEVFKVPVKVVGLSVSSGVPDQPMSCVETKNGAKTKKETKNQKKKKRPRWPPRSGKPAPVR